MMNHEVRNDATVNDKYSAAFAVTRVLVTKAVVSPCFRVLWLCRDPAGKSYPSLVVCISLVTSIMSVREKTFPTTTSPQVTSHDGD